MPDRLLTPTLPPSWASSLEANATKRDQLAAFRLSDKLDNSSFRLLRSECAAPSARSEDKVLCNARAPPSLFETPLLFQETYLPCRLVNAQPTHSTNTSSLQTGASTP